MAKFQEVFSCAIQRQKVAHTKLNDVSSRSYGVLVITILSLWDVDNYRAVVVGKLNLIDLTGNEDNRRTCNERIRLQESAKIDRSLFALSNVIYAPNTLQRKQVNPNIARLSWRNKSCFDGCLSESERVLRISSHC
ncbi:hypothetical protein Q3G72_022612 [Acer saccharum]|nr:hypothetical protein Q3G72_022612 [Acer saccharum]